MPRQSVTLTSPQWAWLEKEAKRLGVSVSEAIRRIVDAHRENAAITEILRNIKK